MNSLTTMNLQATMNAPATLPTGRQCWQRERVFAFPVIADPVITEQRARALCRICGRAAHLRRIDIDVLFALIDLRFGVSQAELLSARRSDALVEARAFATWSLRSLGRPLSYQAIGQELGGRDHSTAINLHQKAVWLRLPDARFRALCTDLADRFYDLREHDHART